MQSAFRIARASPTPPLSSSTARANDLATGCKPLRSLCPPATLRTTHTLLQCPIPSPPLPLSSSRARRSPQSRSACSFASRELLCAWRSTPRPVRPTSLFSRPASSTSISPCPRNFSQKLSHIRCIIRALAAISNRGEFVHAPFLDHHDSHFVRVPRPAFTCCAHRHGAGAYILRLLCKGK